MNHSGFQEKLRPLLIAVPLLGLAGGFAARYAGYGAWPDTIWTFATLPVVAVLAIQILTSLLRRDFGLDIVALISMSAALVFGETLAACVVALMYAGGQYLENLAEKRARREMTALLSRVPRTSMRRRDGALEEVPLDDIRPGDRLFIRQGDVVPVDGTVLGGVAVLDQAALTGESMPMRHRADEAVMSGSTNVGDAFDLTATRLAADSTYAGIVRLVEAAQHSKAPMARLADKYAMAFLAVTIAMAAGAWMVTQDPIRAVAVLVAATPCPLILAVPVALVAGLSQAARHGILIKGAKPLEAMARMRTLVIDKTGTLTEGQPRLVTTRLQGTLDAAEVLRLAASVDQASKHTIARTLVDEARKQDLRLAIPENVTETAGEGVEGMVEGRRVLVGGHGFVARKLGLPKSAFDAAQAMPGSVSVAVALDNAPVGELVFADELRAGTGDLLAGLRESGVERVILATGDRHDIARSITNGLGFDAVRSELTPDQKVLVVLSERKNGPVMMIGDGVNDAPALAAADIGVAMGARGTAASAEAADVVLLVDQLDRILPGIRIAIRSRGIALQSVYAGMGMSIAAMTAAAFGYITPVQGALIQEAIDVAVVLNALRALYDPAEKPLEVRTPGT
jgi:heavy metal translocating P-type ATPase